MVHNEGKQQIYSAFVNDHIKAGEKLVVDAGIRYDYVKSYDGKFSDSTGFLPFQDYDDESWDNLSPRIAGLYRIDADTSICAAVGTAFRAPILDDLYRSGIFRGRIYAANPDLGPEKLISYEAGVDRKVAKRLSLGLTGYCSRGDDFFYPVKVGIDPGTGRDLYQRKNVGEVHIYGAEVEASLEISKTFSLFGNYTYNVSRIEEFQQRPDLEGKYLEDKPRHKANLGLTFNNPSLFRAEIVWRYVGSRYGDTENTSEGELDSSVVFDVKISKRFSKIFDAYLDVLNVFDKKNMYTSDFEGPGIEICGVRP